MSGIGEEVGIEQVAEVIAAMNIKIPVNIYGKFEDHYKFLERINWMRFDEEDGSFLLAKYVVLYDHKDSNWDNDQHLDLFLKQELQGYYIEGVLEYIEYGEYYDKIGLDISDRLTPLVQYIEYYPDNRYKPYTIGDFLQEIVARGGVRHLFLNEYDENFIERRFELESILCSDEMVSKVADARIVTVKELEERLNISEHRNTQEM